MEWGWKPDYDLDSMTVDMLRVLKEKHKAEKGSINMYQNFKEYLAGQINEIRENKLYKNERVIITPQGSSIETEEGKKVLNFCSNNYLGFSNNEEIKQGAVDALKKWGYGLSSVRFICGTQSIHKELEREIAFIYRLRRCNSFCSML